MEAGWRKLRCANDFPATIARRQSLPANWRAPDGLAIDTACRSSCTRGECSSLGGQHAIPLEVDTMPLTVVTGATGGIGRWIALGLAKAGHELILVGRSAQGCETTRDWILSQHSGAKISFVLADLSLLAQTRMAGETIVGQGKPVDVLINNAGVFRQRREETAEGHERVIAVNHLAPFVLTRALLPALQPGARIVNVGSSSSDTATIDPDDLEGRRRWGFLHSYSQSKLALLMVTNHWAERLRPERITANTVHPGTVATGLIRTGGIIGLAWRVMSKFLLTEAQGAEPPLHVALAPEFAELTGTYVKKTAPVAPNRLSLDRALEQRVWDATERLTGPV
jgi:NAD(P)-dependent dehydrogenase (short-subunit alcohol dehydrogenase family)